MVARVQRAWIVGVLVAVGCGGGGTPDWSGTALEPTPVTIEGAAITVGVPKGLPRDADEKPGVWNVTKVEGDHVPKIFISFGTGMQKSPEDFARWHIANKEKMNLVRKETRPDGFAVTDAPADKRRIEAMRLIQLGEKQLECSAVQVADGELPSYDKTRKMLESICDSIVVKQ